MKKIYGIGMLLALAAMNAQAMYKPGELTPSRKNKLLRAFTDEFYAEHDKRGWDIQLNRDALAAEGQSFLGACGLVNVSASFEELCDTMKLGGGMCAIRVKSEVPVVQEPAPQKTQPVDSTGMYEAFSEGYYHFYKGHSPQTRDQLQAQLETAMSQLDLQLQTPEDGYPQIAKPSLQSRKGYATAVGAYLGSGRSIPFKDLLRKYVLPEEVAAQGGGIHEQEEACASEEPDEFIERVVSSVGQLYPFFENGYLEIAPSRQGNLLSPQQIMQGFETFVLGAGRKRMETAFEMDRSLQLTMTEAGRDFAVLEHKRIKNKAE